MKCWSLENEVEGIDTSIVSDSPDFFEYMHMLKKNSFIRVLKTLVRKSLGYDKRFLNSFHKHLGGKHTSALRLIKKIIHMMNF